MELKEKIAQLLLLGFEGHRLSDDATISKDLHEYPLGGVVLFNYHCQNPQLEKNIENPEQVKELTYYLKKAASKRCSLPLFIAIDYEGGNVNRLHESQGFPETKTAKALGSLQYEALITEAKQMAQTLRDHGFNFNFAPVVDLHSNPDNEVIAKLERAFCHQPYRVSEIADYFRRELINENILSTYKHFPGHGSSADDSHKGVVDITNSWHPDELHPYKNLAQNPHHLDTVMVGHLTHHKLDSRGLPATLSSEMIQGLLRNELGFNGLVVSDDMQMDAIASHFALKDAITLALNAGVDLLVFGNQLVETPIRAGEIISLINEAVQTGEIPTTRIDEAFERVQNVKKSLS
jgi:beta-N-acetylhexosaminidase